MARSDTKPRPVRDAPEEAIVRVLRTLHARQQPAAEAAPPLRRVGADRRSAPESERGLYEEARQLFSSLETRLQKQYGIAARLIDGLRERDRSAASAAASQQLLRLRARAGEMAAGRFVVANEKTVPALLEFRPSRLRGAGGDEVSVAVELDPGSLLLAPAEERTVAIRVDLAGAPVGLGERLEVDVDVTEDARVVHRLWVTIDLFRT